MSARESKSLQFLQQGLSLHQGGHYAEALRQYQLAIDEWPENADAWHLSGMALDQTRNHAAAVQRIEKAIALHPASANYWVNLAVALISLGRLDDAEAALRRAISIDPNSASAFNNLGNLMRQRRRENEAIAAYDRTLVLAPNHLNAIKSLATLLIRRRAHAQAIALIQRATRTDPDDPDVWLLLAQAHYEQGQFAAAQAPIETAVRLAPQSPTAIGNLGKNLSKLKRFDEAIVCFKKSLALDGKDPIATNGIAAAHWALGNIPLALDYAQQNFDLDQSNANGLSYLLFLNNYVEQASPSESLAMHRSWDQRFGIVESGLSKPPTNSWQPDKRLRVGFVSPDFRHHSVAYFIEPVFAHHDKDHFEFFAYHCAPDFDATSARLKELVEHWRDVSRQNARELAELVRQDRIDVLIDLAGHTANNRLLSFAQRPAPVQITYLGYPNTTGLSAIDYRITDDRADPPASSDGVSSEQLIRMPDCFLCYQAVPDLPPADTPPQAKNGVITFGSFNVLSKISAPTIDCWINVLRAVPGSRLRLKSLGLASGSAIDRLSKKFAAGGITTERLIFEPYTDSHLDHMTRYREVDIGLDTFPYNGTTTTLEALWMGVPVITLTGDRHAARVGSSLLSAAGLSELVAGSPQHYVQIAKALAEDTARLSDYHASLRHRIANSPLTDGPRFAVEFGKLLRQAWQNRCRRGNEAPARKLHIGGRQRVNGWEILDVYPGPHVDHVCDAKSLAVFPDGCFDVIYASHVLEHFDYYKDLTDVLKEWRKKLKPGGRLMLSVPDLDMLCARFADKARYNASDRYHLMRIIMGGHTDDHDYHLTAFNEEIMAHHLGQAGFGEIVRVGEFDYFEDSSGQRFDDQLISLNVITTNPFAPKA